MGSPPLKGFGQSDPALSAWAERLHHPEDPLLREVRARSAEAGLPSIAVGAMDGLHLEVLARAAGARRAVEIGTLGGYSGVCLLRGMAPDGVLHTFERDPARAAFARDTFRRAGLEGRVHVHVGPALDGLRALEREPPFDLVFIDADKASYPAYLDWAAEHLRPGGIVLADNTFGFGHVHDPPSAGEDAPGVEAIARFVDALANGGRFRATMLPTAEGLSLGVKLR